MPTAPKEIAIGRLQRQLDAIPELKQLRRGSPEFTEWQRNTRVAIAYTFGEESSQNEEFQDTEYSPFIFTGGGNQENYFQGAYIRGLDSAAAKLRSMIREVQEYWPDDPQQPTAAETPETPDLVNTNRVFLIHGRDHGTRDTVASFLRKLELEPVILEEQPDQGLTVIEKFEQNASGSFVVALLTPDDMGGPNAEELNPRARQNVILELGYFIAKFGRDRVRALVKGDIEMPSDYAGVLYIPVDESGGWQMRLVKEMKNAGLNVDANRAL